MKRALLPAIVMALAAATAAYAEDPEDPMDGEVTTYDDEVLPPESAGTSLSQALENHRWYLVSATDADEQPIERLFPEGASPYVFSFTEAMFTFKGDCNNLGGAYQINAGVELQAGPLRSTKMACSQELMQADDALAALFEQSLRIEVTVEPPPQLLLRTHTGETLVLMGQATPEALYGGGELVFLEIDARRFPCRNPVSGQTSCLQAREVFFDEQGLRSQRPGPWRPFYDDIEGYEHTEGQRNVLRLKRFRRDAAAVGDSPYVYVLDLVVETEVVNP